MKKKERRIVRGRCPQCACGDVSFIPPEEMQVKYIGPEEQVEILCPSCGATIKGNMEHEHTEEE
jgi:RNase P subunit RPR2